MSYIFYPNSKTEVRENKVPRHYVSAKLHVELRKFTMTLIEGIVHFGGSLAVFHSVQQKSLNNKFPTITCATLKVLNGFQYGS